jgi:DNA-binding transcriptional regulator GbsR (MarR family)
MHVQTQTAPNAKKEDQQVLQEARRVVAEAVGDLMAFWNFKPSMGRVWACLYLSPRPLTSAEIVEETGLSVGSVSMTLADLQTWGVVRSAGRSGSRRCFEAETDIFKMVTRVFRERELTLIRQTIQKLEMAVRLLDEQGRSSVAAEMLEGRFVATRAQRLLDLAHTGHRMIERFTRVGRIDMGTIRNKLSRRG